MKNKWRAAVAAAVVISLVTAGSGSIGQAGNVAAAPNSLDAPLTQSDSSEQEIHSSNAAAATAVASMTLAAENEALALYYSPKTTEIAVSNKKDGTVWFSNPQDRDQDGKASGMNKSMLSSQLLLNFSDKTGKPQQYNNFNQSVEYEQFEIEKLGDGLKILYTIGEKLRGVEQIPKFISEERFQTLILDKIKDEKKKKDVLSRFNLDENSKLYERRDTALKGMALTKTLRTLEEIGYGEEQMEIDRKNSDVVSQATFVIPVTYRLADDQLVVNVSAENIQNKGFFLHSISVLPYFGAAGTKDQGYMFVPDGSGSLIHLNNNKLTAYGYNVPLYGADSVSLPKKQVLGGSTARLPVFGMKKNDAGFVAIVENGDGIGRIEADVSGRANSYNYVFSSYEITGSDPLALTGFWMQQSVPKFQDRPYNGDITLRYGFLQEKDASYSGMASYYRSYLIKKYGLAKLHEQEQIPFNVELIGGIPTRKFFLGIPYSSYQPLTTFSQAQDILNQLQAEGIRNIKVRYTGWFNGGLNHKIPSSVSVDSKLGGKKGLAELQDFAGRNGITLYPDVSFMRVLHDKGDFKPKRDASRTMNGVVATVQPYDLASYYKLTYLEPTYPLSPARLPVVVDKFMTQYNKLGQKGLSLHDMGDELNSDFNTKNVLTREESKKAVEEQLAKLHTYPNMMVSGGNAYTLPYVDSVVNAPLENSGYNLTDQSVPFYEMALHGYIDYAGEALNLSDEQDTRYHVLKSLETGSGLYFTWFYEKPSLVKETGFDYLYSASYQNWMDEAKSTYAEINNVLSKVRTQIIKDHQMLEKGVYQTTYEDGTSIVVNYNDYPVNVGGAAVEAMGYLMGGERN
ncbi:hypothetical protein A8L34_07680 [Bacillus sp. FJAT-27264]|uniref:DUF5696 domain-containing protein n=1 Tax=Paenibacillus sp. (strain DSM 101736 / FJAT-27264) TaxID=1850362 RepID=UPI000807BD18|nr:DUF5696 domain-containing protein [Bacillus sp. FJAT-27264]OBZ19375.1 hypothetical protein A8L34_07680 [Bacillus sp. FJAT-27264]